MAECYSSSAPIHALASSILGESSFSSKNSRSHHPHLHQGFRSSLQHQFPTDHKKQIDSDSFEQAWSSSGQGFKTEQDRFFFSNGPGLNYHSQKSHHLHRHLPDPNLIASWDHAVQSSANKGLWEQSAGLNSRPPDFSTEFESLHYTLAPSTHSDWASELEAQDRESLKVAQAVKDEDEDDDDDEDEFREEWSNDYFTQAYINSHQSQFQKIQETEQLKEAKLQEERERLKRSTPSSYLASSTAVSGSYPRVTDFQARPRLRVPGLEPEEDERAMFSLDEYTQFNHISDTRGSIQPPKPVHAQDRFLSLVSDLHVAGQIYYPGASLATLPISASDQELDTCTYNNGWAQEFAVETELSAKIQKHLGAEWSWEKLFGKDPRKAAERAQRQLEQQQQDFQNRQTGHVVLTSKEQSEHDRLKAVALSRLQAVFCHLSLTTPPSSSTTPL